MREILAITVLETVYSADHVDEYWLGVCSYYRSVYSYIYLTAIQNLLSVCSYRYSFIHLQYLSQETLRNPRIVRVGNPQFFRGIAEDIRGIVYGCPRNRVRVSAES